MASIFDYQKLIHRLIKTQIGHARNLAWYRGQRPSPAGVILSHEREQIHACENLCSYATSPPHFRVHELLLCDILITRAGDGRSPRYQAKSLACPGCELITPVLPKVWCIPFHSQTIISCPSHEANPSPNQLITVHDMKHHFDTMCGALQVGILYTVHFFFFFKPVMKLTYLLITVYLSSLAVVVMDINVLKSVNFTDHFSCFFQNAKNIINLSGESCYS